MLVDSGQDDALARWLSGGGTALLDRVTGGALDNIAVLDRELIVRYVNWTIPELTREGIIGASVLELVPPGDREKASQTYREVVRTGKGAHFETAYRADDEVLMWDVRVGPIRFEGEVVGLIAITTNVTEQRRAEADRDRFFSLSLDMLVVLTPQGRLKRLNPAFGETLGYGEAELLETPFLALVHPADQPRTQEAFASVLQGFPVTDFENRYRRKDGEYRVFSWRATVDPITGDVYAVARDITDHRATEAQLRHVQKMEAVGQLAGGIAHDFNNIMQAILTNAELAKLRVESSSQVEEHLAEIDAAASRAADLTKQLLAFSRRQALSSVLIDLNALVRGLMNMLTRLLPEKITIELVAARDVASVSGDPTQLAQVVVNLCVNARDAMEEGGKLTIEIANVLLTDGDSETKPGLRPGRYVSLAVRDTGVGMSAEVRERAFEPFFTTKSPHKGTGLGLSTVYGIVRQHGGMVEVQSKVGEGSTFTVYLPADERPASLRGNERTSVPPRGRETVLLAEDDDRVRRAVVRILEDAGYRTLVARNGLEAIRLLRGVEEKVDLVLLDVVMPELTGPDAWAQMKALRPGLRVLFCSGYADGRDLQRLPEGASVVAKPFRSDELLRRVREKLDE